MKNIHVNVQCPPANIPLGRRGENLATCIIFDCTGLVQLYGDGTAELLHKPEGESVYPVAVTQDGASVSWTVSASDTATVGAGRAELRWYVGDTLAKSAKFRTSVSSALADTTTETPPEPQKSWVDKVLAAAQEIKDGAISDEQLADAAAQIEQNTKDISSLSDEIDYTKKIGLSAAILTFEQGGLASSNGSETENDARIRSDIVKIIKGSKIKLNDALYKFGVWQYSESGDYKTYRGLEQTDFVANEDMRIRIVISKKDGSSAIGISESGVIDAYLYSHDISKMDSDVDKLNSTVSEVEKLEIDNWKTGYVATNQENGEIVPMTRGGTSQWVYQVVTCAVGDKFLVTGFGGNKPKSWCFTDEKFMKLSGGNTTSPLYTEEIEATEAGFLIVNSDISYDYKLEKLCAGIAGYGDTRRDAEKSIRGFSKYDKIMPPSMPEIRYCIESVPRNKTTVMTLDEIIGGYDDLVENYPNYVTKTLLGNDTSGTYPIYRYDFCPSVPKVNGTVKVISHSYEKTDYPVVIMDACIHGAERPCAKALLNLMTLIANAKDNSILGWLKDNIHFVIVPVSNVWGYVNNSRNNANGVDLNRNFPIYWEKGDDTTDNDRYRGESALSEAESGYLNNILQEFEGNAVCYYNWHTHGLFTGYDVMTCFSISALKNFDTMQNIGFDIIKSITASGWSNHNLPTDSGYIGFVNISTEAGLVSHTGAMHNIPSACPEVMYRYYDGGTGEAYNNDIDCMNVEYMLYAVGNACKKFLYN